MFVELDAFEDGLSEDVEGFIIYLQLLDEPELDARDVGQVNISRAVYLVRINQSGITKIFPLFYHSA